MPVLVKTNKKVPDIDAKKVWKDFTQITTNKPSKSDIPTLRYKILKLGVLIDWGDYKHLGNCLFKNAYFEKLGTDKEGFVLWLESQGLTSK